MSFAEGYIDVAARIEAFYAKYPDGSLQMEAPEWVLVNGEEFIQARALAYRAPDDPRPGVGHAWEAVPGRTPYTKGSELMNLETSCWGRALAALGIATKQGIATSQEVQGAESRRAPAEGHAYRATATGTPASAKQVGFIRSLMKRQGLNEVALHTLTVAELGFELPAGGIEALTANQASSLIKRMNAPQKPVTRSAPAAPEPDDPWAGDAP